MAGNLTLVKENEVLEELVGKDPAVTRYIGLLTTVCDEDGAGEVEASAGNYARKSTAAGDWENAAAGAIQNGNDIIFIEANAEWGLIVAAGIYESLAGDDMVAWFDLDANKQVDSGDTMKFAAGAIDITCT